MLQSHISLHFQGFSLVSGTLPEFCMVSDISLFFFQWYSLLSHCLKCRCMLQSGLSTPCHSSSMLTRRLVTVSACCPDLVPLFQRVSSWYPVLQSLFQCGIPIPCYCFTLVSQSLITVLARFTVIPRFLISFSVFQYDIRIPCHRFGVVSSFVVIVSLVYLHPLSLFHCGTPTPSFVTVF